MNWICNRIYRKQKGFTLVELMVVIIILAVLTGIAIPSYLALRNRARESAAKAEMVNIATAIELFFSDYSQYPPDTLAVLVNELQGEAAATVNTAGYVYMATVPTADPWGGAYDYDTADPTTTYTLSCSGSADTITDGQPSWTD